MGQSKSKDEGKGSSKSTEHTDGFMGQRRFRTFLIGGCLVAFCICAIAFFADAADQMRQLNENTSILSPCGAAKILEPDKPCFAQTFMIGYYCQLAGCAMILIFSAFAAMLHCVKCDGGIETVVGWLLLIGGIVYFIGCIIVMTKFKDFGVDDTFITTQIGEAILPSFTAIILGLDVVMDFMEQESKRLLWNLITLATTSGFCLIGYYDYIGGDCDSCAAIGIGYTIIIITSIVYIVLNLCDCITCNCDDNPLIRIIIAIALIVGGIIVAIGYYTSTEKFKSRGDLIVSFYIGYTILICGLCIFWAMDMGVADKLRQVSKK